jgi:hypothetical protein
MEKTKMPTREAILSALAEEREKRMGQLAASS